MPTEIRKSRFLSLNSLNLVTNIRLHEKPEPTRTSVFDVLGEDEEFAEFEVLLEKCARADRNRRPRNAMKLRDEIILVDFLRRIEAGERPCDLVPPPFEDENEAQVRQLREELVRKNGIIEDLQNRLNIAVEGGQRMRQELTRKDQTIVKKNQVYIIKKNCVLEARDAFLS